MRIVALSCCALAGVLLRGSAMADGRDQSASAPLLVSATVVSSCAVATANGQVAFHCAKGARGPVRVGEGVVTVAVAAETHIVRHTTAAGLVTIDF